jgi:peptide/nickel transport system permease protein
VAVHAPEPTPVEDEPVLAAVPRAGAATGHGRAVLRRFLAHRLAVGALVLLGVIVLTSVLGGHLWRFRAGELRPQDASSHPSWTHPFGTDELGRDTFAQVLRGTRRTLEIMTVVTALATAAGVLVGAVAGWVGGWVDAVLMRLIDVLLTVPLLAVLVVLSHRYQRSGSWVAVAGVVAAFAWMAVARIVRAEVRSLRPRGFVDAARVAGAGGPSIVVRHVLPNIVGAVVVSATLTMAGAVLAESTLSYLGFGVQSPDTSLGLLVSAGQTAAQTRPWLFWFPGGTILVLVLCVHVVGDALRDAFDPHAEDA